MKVLFKGITGISKKHDITEKEFNTYMDFADKSRTVSKVSTFTSTTLGVAALIGCKTLNEKNKQKIVAGLGTAVIISQCISSLSDTVRLAAYDYSKKNMAYKPCPTNEKTNK